MLRLYIKYHTVKRLQDLLRPKKRKRDTDLIDRKLDLQKNSAPGRAQRLKISWSLSEASGILRELWGRSRVGAMAGGWAITKAHDVEMEVLNVLE